MYRSPISLLTFFLVCVNGHLAWSEDTIEPGVDITELKTIYSTAAEGKLVSSLQAGLKRLYEVQFEVSQELPNGKDAPGIFVGRVASMAAGLVSEEDLAKVHLGGYVAKCKGRQIAVSGANAACTRHGVEKFLERLGLREYRGVSWLTRKPERLLKPFTVHDRPAIAYRSFTTRDQYAMANQAEDREVLGDVWIDHSAGYLVPKNLFYDEHPEYYAMLKSGERIPKEQFTGHRTPLCLANPEVTRVSIERAFEWIEKQPDRTFFPITYGDTGVWCQCQKCLTLDPAPGQYATRLLHWVNAVARAIGAKHPDKIIYTFAYGGSDVPPPTVRPDQNVWMCASVGLASIRFWEHSMATGHRSLGPSLSKLNGWLEVAPEQMTVCEYQSGKYYPALPDVLAAKHSYYAETGIRGIMFTFGHPISFKPVWEFLYPRLMWNPKQDAHALTADFVKHYYAPAGAPLAEYFALCHGRYIEMLEEVEKLKGRFSSAFYASEFTEKALACFDRAERAASANKGLRKTLMAEERLFIMDWMRHPQTKALNEEAKSVLDRQLTRSSQLVGESEKEQIEFARAIHRLAVAMESERKGILAFVEEWLKGQDYPMPDAQKIPGGVRMTASMFMYDGWGPRLYKGHAHPVPPKIGAAVYVKGNSANRSHRMVAKFELDEIPGDGSATLDIEGQDCDHEVDTAEIRIEINGTSIYEGQVQMVKWNWSRQSFKVPAGLLKMGKNKLEVLNAADLKSIEKWHERWFMLSMATIKFAEEK